MTKLSLTERVQILSILPREGDIKTLRIVKDLAEKVNITKEEIEKFQFELSPEGNAYTWNKEGTESVLAAELTKYEEDEIRSALMKLEGTRKLSMSLVPLYERFVENRKPE